MTNETFNLDAILDASLDDLADLPEFRNYPAGTHRVQATLVQRQDKRGFDLKLVAEETIELADPTETPLERGAKATIMFLLNNDIGQGKFKNLLKAMAEKFGPASPRELIEQFGTSECLVVTKLRSNKEKTQQYVDLVSLAVI